MSLPSSLYKWLRLPSRIALLVGVGTVSAVAAKADTAGADQQFTRVPQQSAKSFGELLIWSDGGRIYVSESGKPAQELRLGDTAEARHLRQILEREGAAPGSPRVVRDRMILVGGGGEGFHWAPAAKADSPDRASGSAATGGSAKATSPGTSLPTGQGRDATRANLAGSDAKK
jgi:hypothetical protein